ncbi:MAG: hypothetical protein HY013_12130 [Candidatus Solibacter usitatus]|nr:hypothetical protein [Candidatus Solibacter usitatus]
MSTSVSAGLMQAGPQVDREFEAGGTGSTSFTVPVTVERRQAGKPHRGKVLAAIQPHCDDIPILREEPFSSSSTKATPGF